jgi:hypothetical protein
MARRPHEQKVIDRFAAHLGASTGRLWNASRDEVSTGKNARYYDCELTSPRATPIAADVCSLFPSGSHPKEQAKRARFSERLLAELRNVEVGGLMVETPPIQKKHAHRNWHKATAEKIRDVLSRQLLSEQAVEIEVEGCSIKRIADDSESSFTYHSQFSGIQPVDGAGHPLAMLLRDKHEQLDVDAHDRYLIAVTDGWRAHAADVRDACAFINFDQYPNFDRIYFEESEGRFHLVYDRKAWHSMESGTLPEDEEGRRLVIPWLEARLSGGWPGALATALQICWQRHSCDWLTEGGRELLEMEAHLLLVNCEWETPRKLWEMFRGPVPTIVDARRKATPINAPPLQKSLP